MTTQPANAYEECAEITRHQARNFSYGIRLLPPDKRRAMCAVYALARRVDDAADEPGLGREERLARLDRLRRQVTGVEPAGDDPVFVALADAAARFPIPMSAFAELVDGVEMDVRGTTYRTFADLEVYCRRVAGTIGRLSLGVFGTDDPARAEPLADALGVALQLTNILRDLREDTAAGRCYLPTEDLERFGVRLVLDGAGGFAGPTDRLVELVRFEADRARRWYGEGLTLLRLLDRRSAACAGAMAGIYARLLRRIAAEPQVVLVGRVSLPTWQKALVAARSMAGATS